MYREPEKYPTGVKDIHGIEIRKRDCVRKSGKKESGVVLSENGRYRVFYINGKSENLGKMKTRKKWEITESTDWKPEEKAKLRWILTTKEGQEYLDYLLET